VSQAASRPEPLASDVAKASLGFAGLAMCITLMYLGMRAVMDIGGACAEGGPYVPRVECPDGAPAALIGGMFGWFLFAAIATVYGSRLGGIWAGAPVLAWSGLFLALGWNFLSYGVLDPPGDEGIIWGWALCAVIFILMGGLPLLGLGGFIGMGGPGALYGNSRPPAPRSPNRTFPLGPATAADEDVHATIRSALAAAHAGPAPAADGPGLSPEPGEPAFSEGTQALLDRLERLADLRDRGLLAPDEYETAKETIVRELEDRA
jgi:hypothetical protein